MILVTGATGVVGRAGQIRATWAVRGAYPTWAADHRAAFTSGGNR
jgi:hypothetical protein